ncbi:hypothetical protein JTE90_016326 [Oedothorax gibbosus]|uniref:Uncharacterized protein n=1 Tax=Oedothorax gibbosus TaxID=931172 RepID=A0AAV6TQL5_9ARAC|nr:hypothetical protein JTE90_016326 [Oedothorax gibbosus]
MDTMMRHVIRRDKRIVIAVYTLSSSSEYRAIGNLFGVQIVSVQNHRESKKIIVCECLGLQVQLFISSECKFSHIYICLTIAFKSFFFCLYRPRSIRNLQVTFASIFSNQSRSIASEAFVYTDLGRFEIYKLHPQASFPTNLDL